MWRFEPRGSNTCKPALQVSAFMFDYRGYGRSDGVPTVPGVLQDARAARAKLRELAGVEDSGMLIMGESLGGAVAVQLAAESAPKALILQSTFSSMRDVADYHYPKLSWLVPAEKLDSVTQITRYRGPLLQSHGDADRTIPFALGEKLFQAANEPKTFVRITVLTTTIGSPSNICFNSTSSSTASKPPRGDGMIGRWWQSAPSWLCSSSVLGWPLWGYPRGS